jgi:hypothetical protein
MHACGHARLGFTLVAILAAGIARAAPDPGAGQATPAQPFPPADARRAPGSKDLPEVVALLRERCDVLKMELDLARKHLGDPIFRADAWSSLAERLLVAETDMAETPAERIAAYRIFRDNLKLMEDQLKGVPEPQRGQGLFEYGQKLWIRGRRLQAEVTLLRAELAKGETSSADDDPPAVREAILAWRDAVHQWVKMWVDSRLVLIPGFARQITATTLEADLAVASKQAEQIAAYQTYRDRLLAVEKDTKAEVDRRRYNVFDHLRIKEMRCEAEVTLGRLKSGGDKSTDKDTPEVRNTLDEWVETIHLEMDVIRKRYDAGKIPPGDSLVVDENLLHEELTAARKPEEQVAAYKKFLAKLKEAEAILKPRSENGPAEKMDFGRVTFKRAATELSLLQLTAGAGAKGSLEEKNLLKEQRDCLRTELGLRMADWAAGQGDFQSLQESAGNLLLAELETAATPADRLAAYQAHLQRMQTADSQCKPLIDPKKGNEAWLLWTRGARLEAETWLLRAKGNLAAAKP